MKRTSFLDPEGTIVFKAEQDEKPIIDANRRFQNDFDGYTKSRDMKHVARVPNIIIEQWIKESGLNLGSREFTTYCARKLNDPENAYLRTGGGQIKV